MFVELWVWRHNECVCRCYFNKNKRDFSGRGVLFAADLRLHTAQSSMHASWHGPEDWTCTVCFLNVYCISVMNHASLRDVQECRRTCCDSYRWY